MSSFCGRMHYYRSFSIDRFDQDNLQSTGYFLSHCHEDHMVGLDSNDFIYRLKSNSFIKIYCSEITKSILLNGFKSRYSALQNHIVVLEVEQPELIDVYTNQRKVESKVTVTFLHSGHCPGSVMMLFEGDEGCVLYTGDIRLDQQAVSQMVYLHDGMRPKKIKALYIDTTFCVPSALYIPSREDCTKVVLELVSDWLSNGFNYVISLVYNASIGYETLFKQISTELQMKIHVQRWRASIYSHISDMLDYVTTDCSSTQIHACRSKRHSSRRLFPCDYAKLNDIYDDDLNVRTIYLSTMSFVQSVGREEWVRPRGADGFHVCYSFHSSYAELRDIISYLQPQSVYPNVIPGYQEGETFKSIQVRLNKFLKMNSEDVSKENSLPPQALGEFKSKKRKISQNSGHGSLDFDCFTNHDKIIHPPTIDKTNALPAFHVDYNSDSDSQSSCEITYSQKSGNSFSETGESSNSQGVKRTCTSNSCSVDSDNCLSFLKSKLSYISDDDFSNSSGSSDESDAENYDAITTDKKSETAPSLYTGDNNIPQSNEMCSTKRFCQDENIFPTKKDDCLFLGSGYKLLNKGSGGHMKRLSTENDNFTSGSQSSSYTSTYLNGPKSHFSQKIFSESSNAIDLKYISPQKCSQDSDITVDPGERLTSSQKSAGSCSLLLFSDDSQDQNHSHENKIQVIDLTDC